VPGQVNNIRAKDKREKALVSNKGSWHFTGQYRKVRSSAMCWKWRVLLPRSRVCLVWQLQLWLLWFVFDDSSMHYTMRCELTPKCFSPTIYLRNLLLIKVKSHDRHTRGRPQLGIALKLNTKCYNVLTIRSPVKTVLTLLTALNEMTVNDSEICVKWKRQAWSIREISVLR